ncbi:MAG: aspartate--tRNA(Asn) ligase [Rickettsiales bacterium]|jgi:aspartyl-tRNA synthetase|nr:aspartate--tRNA(Asn) ligase [Rickettsiales bacterium]
MIQHTKISELKSMIGQTATIIGFSYIMRKQSSVAFVIVRDISGQVQVVFEKSNAAAFDTVRDLTAESNIKITGLVKEAPNVKGGIEILAETIEVIAASESELPLAVYEKNAETAASPDVRYQSRFLDLRRPENALIMKLRSTLDRCYREYLTARGGLEVHTPKLMPTPSESHADLFELEYFGGKAYLAQSPQLYKQMAIAAGMEFVFEIGQIFRAEKSFTTRHATETISLDVEKAYVDKIEDLMDLEEGLLTYFIEHVIKEYGPEIKEHFGIDLQLPKPFARITLRAAKEIAGGTDFDEDLTSEQEKLVGAHFAEQGIDFVFVHTWPISARGAFYHKWRDGFSQSADLLYKGVEITTLALREENYEELLKQLAVKGLKQDGLQWYLDFFRYGVPPHGGWGTGAARIIKQMLNLDSIRDAEFIFRGPNKIFP